MDAGEAPTFDGKKLKYARARAGMSQMALCVAAGIPATATLRRWESGKFCPSFNMACKLAHTLGVEITEFASAP